MRATFAFLGLFLSSLSLLAQSPSGIMRGSPIISHVRIDTEADTIALPVTVTIHGKNPNEVDLRIEEIHKVLEKRFENQDGWWFEEETRELAHAEYRSSAKVISGRNSGSVLLGDASADEDKNEPTSYVATATWSLRVWADKGAKGLEILRAKASDLVKAKAENEKQTVGQAEFMINDPEQFRNDLLDQVKNDFEEVKKHLPDGQYTLEISSLQVPLIITRRTGRHFSVSLQYRISFITPKPEKPAK